MSWISRGIKPHICELPGKPGEPLPDDVELGAVWQCEEHSIVYISTIEDQRYASEAEIKYLGRMPVLNELG